MFEFNLTNDSITEGESLAISLTSTSAIPVGTQFRWEITPQGLLPVTFGASGDFMARTGVETFSNTDDGAEFKFSIDSLQNTRYGPTKDFAVRVYKVNDDPNTADELIGSSIATLTDDDDIIIPRIASLQGDNNKNILELGGFQTLTVNGVGGDDLLVVSKFLYGDVTIRDILEVNTIRFDAGVEIVDVNEDVTDFRDDFGSPGMRATIDDLINVFGVIEDDTYTDDDVRLLSFNSITYTLSTGGTVTIATPDADNYLFQIGDGEAKSYVDFRDDLKVTDSDGDLVDPTEANPFVVDSYGAFPDLSGNSEPTRDISIQGTSSFDDILMLSGEFDALANGSSGNDYFVISRYLSADITIRDLAGVNTIRFDDGVQITSVAEVSSDQRDDFFGVITADVRPTIQDLISFGLINDASEVILYTSVVYKLATGGTVTVAVPGSPSYLFQIGDGEAKGYVDFRDDLKVTDSDGDLVDPTEANPFVVPSPLDDGLPPAEPPTPPSDAPELIDRSGGTMFDSAENQLAVTTLSASDADGDTLTWSLTSGADVTSFAIDENTGVITWVDEPDYETAKSFADSKEFRVTATATDSTGATENIALTITLTDVNEAPVIHTEAVALSAPATATEGAAYSFDITPTALLSSAATIRWEIAQKGALPVASSDFSAFTGTLDFTSGVTAAQTVTITPTDDANLEASKDFELRLYDGTDLLATQAVTLKDNDAGTFGIQSLSGNANVDVFGAGTAYDLILDGGIGDDIYVITRYQHGTVTIDDTLGSANLIKFDAGVTITGFSESGGGRAGIAEANLTLSTGAVIKINSPAFRLNYQIGDGAVITGDGSDGSAYAEFKTAIKTSDIDVENPIDAPFEVLAYTSVPTPSGTLDAQSSSVTGTAAADVFSAASSYDLTQNGGLGDDTFVITRFQYGPVEIRDTLGDGNLIKFDAGVTIEGVSETKTGSGSRARFSDATLTLSTGAKVKIERPAIFDYQLGDGEVIDSYAQFKSEIGATVENDPDNNLLGINTYTVPLLDFAPTSADKTLAVSSDENQQVVTTLVASDVDRADTLAWTLTGADMAFFAIDENTGAVTWKDVPDFETIKSDGGDSVFRFTATATDAADATDSIDITVTLLNVNEAPIINGGATTLEVTSDENQPVAATLTATEVDEDDSLTWDLVGGDSDLFEIVGGVITWKETPDYEDSNLLSDVGTKTFITTARVTDSGGEEDFTTVYVTLTDVNDAPVIASPDGGTAIETPEGEGQEAVIKLSVSDADEGADGTKDSLTWVLSGDDAKFFKLTDDGEIRWNGIPDYDDLSLVSEANSKVFSVTVTVRDGAADDATTLTDDINLEIRLLEVNAAPVIDQGDATLEINSAENQLAVTTLTATDDSTTTDDLIWSLVMDDDVNDDADLFVINNGVITWEKEPDYESTLSVASNRMFSFTAMVGDGEGGADSVALTVTLIDEVETPILAPDII